MEVTNYYITTLTNAAMKIGPLLIFLVAGYFIFFKLPFLFLLNNMKKSKQELQKDQGKTTAPTTQEPAYSVKDYERFIHRKKTLEALPEKKTEEKKSENKKSEEKKRSGDKKKEEPKAPPRKSDDQAAEVLFEVKPGQPIIKEELRKKYHELLRMNHPDKVAALSPDFKKLADQKTKEINNAYAKLLKRAG